MNQRRALLASGLAGLLLSLSFPKFGSGWVAWVAVLPLLIALAARAGVGSARLGYATGVVSSLGVLYWTGIVVAEFGGLSATLAVLAVVALSIVVGLFLAAFAGIVGCWLRAFGNGALLAAPLAWVSVEVGRRYLLFSFPWCLLGYSQHDNLAAVQIAAVTGVYGVSALVLVPAAALAYALQERQRARHWLVLTCAAAVVGLTLGWGAWRLRTPVASVGTLRVGLVQASIPQDEKWDGALAWQHVERHVALSREAAQAGARLVVWPESAVPFYFDTTPVVADMLRALVREERIHLLFGNDDRSGQQVWVGAKLLTPRGCLALRYHKMLLVPFGEYVPFEGVFGALGVQKLVQEAGSFTPGTEARVGGIETTQIGTSICYEAIFPDLVRRFTARGAELLANITNDGWYGRTSGPYQHFAMARLRAVENGRSLVRAANTGISALIDPRGRVLAKTELFERRALVGDVPLVREQTFYARHGDVFAWACVAASALLTALALLRRARARRAGQAQV